MWLRIFICKLIWKCCDNKTEKNFIKIFFYKEHSEIQSIDEGYKWISRLDRKFLELIMQKLSHIAHYEYLTRAANSSNKNGFLFYIRII